MAIQINNKQIQLSVRDLARTAAHKSKLLTPFPLPQRGMLGKQAQAKVQKKETTLRGIFHQEKHVRQVFKYRGYTITVQGRIDGLFERPDQIDIEEIKSVILQAKDFKNIDIDDYQEYTDQVLIYAYLIQKDQPKIRINPVLILINLINDQVKKFILPFIANKVKNLIHQKFSEIIQNYTNDEKKYQKQLKSLAAIDFALPELRRQQQEIISTLSQALQDQTHVMISAPTGTGKTAGVLYPAIQYAIKNRKRIIYVTPKTTQQDIIRQTYGLLADQGLEMTVCFLRASRKMCANDIFFCHEDYCPFARNYQDESLKSNLLAELLKEKTILPETVYEKAKNQGMCPSEVMFDIAMQADILVGDYNYIFDPQVQIRHLFQSDDLSDWILIIDEAHNLYDRAITSLSPSMSHQELKELKKGIINKKHRVYQKLYKSLENIEHLFRELYKEGRNNYPDQQYFIHQLDLSVWKKALFDYEMAFIGYLMFKIKKNLLILEDPFEGFYYALRGFIRIAELERREFVPYYEAGHKGSLTIQCVDPSEHLHNSITSFHNAIAMSGTLDPIKYYRENLGFPVNNTQLLEVSSPFSTQNRQILIIPNISTYYKDRPRLYPDYARIVKDISSLKSGNYIVFCPSFEFIQNMYLFLATHGAEILIQRPNLSPVEKDEYIERMHQKDQPCLLLAVMGGIFSEGIDLRGDKCIGVIIFSPALPPITIEKELIKHYHDEKNGMGVEAAYIYPGINKVIQSVGRLIRSHDDKGIIVLTGERFAQEEINQLFPAYWFENTGDVVITEDYKTTIEDFWSRFE